MWLGLQYNRGSGLTWVDGQRIVAYPASSRLFVWESRRLLSQEVSYAKSSRQYAFYIDGDIAKLPGGGRRGAAVLCELLPGEESEEDLSVYILTQESWLLTPTLTIPLRPPRRRWKDTGTVAILSR